MTLIIEYDDMRNHFGDLFQFTKCLQDLQVLDFGLFQTLASVMFGYVDLFVVKVEQGCGGAGVE